MKHLFLLILLLCFSITIAQAGAIPRQHIVIKLSEQLLYLYDGQELEAIYPVSTSRFGAGNRVNSGKTPLGLHYIIEKIGAKQPLYTVFKYRRPLNLLQPPIPASQGIYITTRILRLQGLEPGINLGKGVDTLSRGIYIHGTSAEDMIGTPGSRGCIRMRNQEIIELFDAVPRFARVRIQK
jgi:hypothetical protein